MSIFGLPNKTFNCLLSIGSRSCRKTEPFIKDKPSSLRTTSVISQLTLGPPCFMQHPKQNLHFLSPVKFVFGGPVCLSGECFKPQADPPTPTHDYVSIFSKYIANLTYHQPRAIHRHSDLDPTLFHFPGHHVYIRTDTHNPPPPPPPLALTTKDHFLSYPKATNTLSFKA